MMKSGASRLDHVAFRVEGPLRGKSHPAMVDSEPFYSGISGASVDCSLVQDEHGPRGQ